MPEKKPFSCPECAAEFQTKEELDGHNRKEHDAESKQQPERKQEQKGTA